MNESLSDAAAETRLAYNGRSMRVLHTSDWHLGHALHGVTREVEHAAFLAWLVDVVDREAVDVVLLAGDVFHTANPSAAAQASWYRFLADVRGRCPQTRIVVIAGNHDSPSRLDAPRPLLDALDVHVVGRVVRDADGTLDTSRLAVPLRERGGRDIVAWCAAVPHVRPADLVGRPGGDGPDEFDPAGAVRALYADVFASIANRSTDAGLARLAMGHLFLVGTEVSRLSERTILGGDQHALPVELFPRELAYVALGHLHKAQRVGRRENVRYSGSPLPLSMAEIDYRHQVVLVDLDGSRVDTIRPLPVPRTVEFLRIPRVGHAPLADVLDACRELPAVEDGPAEWLRPFLEVRVRLDAPIPDLRARVEEAVADRGVRLVAIDRALTGTGRAAGDVDGGAELELARLSPERVLELRWARDHDAPLDAGVRAAFAALLEEVQHGEAGA